MGKGSGGSAMLDLKAGPMRAHDYTTLFKLEHMLKDVRLCLEEAQAADVPFPAAARARDVLVAAMGADTPTTTSPRSSRPLEELAGLERREELGIFGHFVLSCAQRPVPGVQEI